MNAVVARAKAYFPPERSLRMDFFVDTALIDDIRELNEYGLLDGVTTNPLPRLQGRPRLQGDRGRDLRNDRRSRFRRSGGDRS